jgi:hypothetical protein
LRAACFFVALLGCSGGHSSVDAGADARVALDAFVPIDAFVPRDAFVPHDAFVPADAPGDAGPDASCSTPCVTGYVCFEGTCVDPHSIGCCSGTACPGETFCDMPACICEHWSVLLCDPECSEDEVCRRGTCLPRCLFDGCPDPEAGCTDDGCRRPMCTDDECRAMSLVCDRYVGCFDPCADPALLERCAMLGQVCMLGACVDP